MLWWWYLAHLYVPTPSCGLLTIANLKISGFDRDLGVAGRVMTRAKDGSIVQKLVKVDRPSKYRTGRYLFNAKLTS